MKPERGLTTLETCFAMMILIMIFLAIFDLFVVFFSHSVLTSSLRTVTTGGMPAEGIESGLINTKVAERLDMLLPLKGLSCSTARTNGECCDQNESYCLSIKHVLTDDPPASQITAHYKNELLVLSLWKGLLGHDEEVTILDGTVAVTKTVPIYSSNDLQRTPAYYNPRPEEEEP